FIAAMRHPAFPYTRTRASGPEDAVRARHHYPSWTRAEGTLRPMTAQDSTTSPEGAPVPPVLYDVADGVATIRLNRPDAMNSLDIATKELLRDTVQHAAEDPAARCVVLTGTGRAF